MSLHPVSAMQPVTTFTAPPPQAVAPPNRVARPRKTAPRPIIVLQPGQRRRARITQPETSRRVVHTAPSQKSHSRSFKTESPKKPQQASDVAQLSEHVSKELKRADTMPDDILVEDVAPRDIVANLNQNGKTIRARDSTSQAVITAKKARPRAPSRKETTKSSEDLLKTSPPKIQSHDDDRVDKTADFVELNDQGKEQTRKAYLDEQLEKRQIENATRNAKSALKQRKRVRRATPSLLHIKKSAALKDTFKAYMDEISREDLLDQGEVIKLARQINQGVQIEQAQRTMKGKLGRRPSVAEIAKKLGTDVVEVQRRHMAGTAAKNALVAANLRLVTSVARKVASSKTGSHPGLALDDMVQEGSVGLIRAAEKFDAARGYKFSTYATWWIRAYVMRSISSQSRSIKVPGTIIDEYARIRKEYTALLGRGIFAPTDEEVAERVGVTVAKLRFVINVVTQIPTSLDLNLSSFDGTANSRTLGEIIESDVNIEERMVEDMQRKELDYALQQCLSPLERAVVRLRFGLDDGQPRTLRETGVLLGLSKERVRQLIFRALPKMKTPEIQRILVEATTQ